MLPELREFDAGASGLSSGPSCCQSRKGRDHRADHLRVTALGPHHDAVRPLDFQPPDDGRWIADDRNGHKSLLGSRPLVFAAGLPQPPSPNMKRARGQLFLGTEPDNALPAGLLTLNHLPPMPPPIRTPALRHRLVLRMPIGTDPGIQPTTARNTGDSLTVTLCREPARKLSGGAPGRGFGCRA